jgi:hypothetical protein
MFHIAKMTAMKDPRIESIIDYERKSKHSSESPKTNKGNSIKSTNNKSKSTDEINKDMRDSPFFRGIDQQPMDNIVKVIGGFTLNKENALKLGKNRECLPTLSSNT